MPSHCRSSERDEKDRLKLPVKRKADATAPTEMVPQPKKKDGRGRPRKDRTLAAQQQAAAAAASAAVATPQVKASQAYIITVCSVKYWQLYFGELGLTGLELCWYHQLLASGIHSIG